MAYTGFKNRFKWTKGKMQVTATQLVWLQCLCN